MLMNHIIPFFLAAAGDAGLSPGMPVRASTFATGVDWVWDLILGISLLFFVLIIGLMILFIFQYRAREGHESAPTPSHNTRLEVIWTVIPTIIVGIIFFFGFRGYMDMAVVPRGAYSINVLAQRWSWQFQYPNGHVDNELHVPVDRPVKLVMTSDDVIHGFYVPAFRVKRDIVPGRYNTTWFEATEPGEYDIFCAEYCGTGHSDMLSKVIVHKKGDFEKWLSEAADLLGTMTPAEAGEWLYNARGCKQCHTIDGAARIGPTFKGDFGTERALKDGSKVTVDENYIRRSILDPQSQIAAGFEPVMPTYKGRVTDEEITMIIEFLKSLNPESGDQ